MSFKDKLKNKILNQSDMYNFYKKEYESSKKKLQQHDKILDSYQNLFNTLYLDYELQPKGLLKDIQEVCTELLVFISKICEKYEINWWLNYGNLLGAVRHGSFVPWDDDTDIGMMREDYDKFVEAINKEIKEKNIDWIELRWRRNVNEYVKKAVDGKPTYSFLQIFLNKPGFNHTLAQVDVFPYDYIKDYDGRDINKEYYDTKMIFYRDIANGLSLEEVIEKYYNNLNLSKEKQDYFIPGAEGAHGKKFLYKLTVFESAKVFPLKTIDFKGHEFPCPNDYDYYLRSIYGHYMRIPKTVRAHGRLNKLRYDDQELLEKSIEELREFNENFK
ncbi:MAG: LicD family protein [archaeon]|nr:LicD family protein [archaeon]